MTANLDRIADTLEQAQTDRISQHAALLDLASIAETRGGVRRRRSDGAFFTADDVAQWLVRRAIAPQLLTASGATADHIDAVLANGAAMHRAIAIAATDSATREAMRTRLVSLTIFDPTCGSGAFLIAAWRELEALERMLDRADTAHRTDLDTQVPVAPRVTAAQLHGLDRDADAVAACRASLHIVTGSDDSCIRCGDALDDGRLLTGAAADVLVGNPPFVRARPASAPPHVRSAAAGNVAAWIVERAMAQAAPGARCGFVLPIAAACSDTWGELRAQWHRQCQSVFTSHFDTIPATLFPGVVQRLTMFEGAIRAAVNDVPTAWYTTRYHRWKRSERTELLDRVRFVPLPRHQLVPGSIAKVGSPVEAELLDRLAQHQPAGRLLADSSPAATGAVERTADCIYYKRRWSYFLLFVDFVPDVWAVDGSVRTPTECKVLRPAPGVDPRVLLTLYSSSLFWWFFSVFTDNRNVNRRELERFPAPDFSLMQSEQLCELGDRLSAALRACAEVRECTYRSIGTIRNTYFRQGMTRPVLDEIDAVLADAYGMTRSELDFILGFERRFRS